MKTIDISYGAPQTYTVDYEQYEENFRDIAVCVVDGDGAAYDLSAYSARLAGYKPDTHLVYRTGTIVANCIHFDVSQQMTAVATTTGYALNLVLISADKRETLVTILFKVKAAAVQVADIVSTDDINVLDNITAAQLAEIQAFIAETYKTSELASFKTAAETARDAASASAASAAESASQAAQSATNAAESEQLSGISATDAATHELEAKDYADAAGLSATAAGQAATQAGQSATNAAASATAAGQAATQAAQSADNASTSATAANTSASNASSSASAAAKSEANAASSATAAANSAASIVVVNDLTTGGTTKALSAEQGKTLSASINTLTSTTVNFSAEQSLTTAQRYQARKNIGAAAVVDIKDAYELQEAVRQGRANQILSVGDFFTVGRGGTDWLFQVAAFDYDVPVNPNFTHSLRLLMYPCFASVAFDAPEAIYYAAAELAAGTYWFINNRTSKYYSFTTTRAIPAGGQAVPVFGGSPDYTITQLKTYASQASTTALETVTATIRDIAPTTGTQLTPVNDDNRARFGNNNWMQSAIRQWLNSAATTGWWTPKNNYDRPLSSPTDGFLNGIDADLLACIGKVRLRTGLNPADNAGTFGYSDNEELIFLPSRTEMGFGNSSTNIYETPVAADGTAKTDTLPLFTNNASRIKYTAGVARDWWMRSPHTPATTAHGTYRVSPAGVVDVGSVYNLFGAVPACVIY